jgi:hypothetical protein
VTTQQLANVVTKLATAQGYGLPISGCEWLTQTRPFERHQQFNLRGVGREQPPGARCRVPRNALPAHTGMDRRLAVVSQPSEGVSRECRNRLYQTTAVRPSPPLPRRAARRSPPAAGRLPTSCRRFSTPPSSDASDAATVVLPPAANVGTDPAPPHRVRDSGQTLRCPQTDRPPARPGSLKCSTGTHTPPSPIAHSCEAWNAEFGHQ